MTITQGGVDPDYTYSAVISSASLDAINMNRNRDTWLIDPINASTRSLYLTTNETNQMSISATEPWEIEINEPNRGMRSLAKSGLRDAEPEPTIEIDQMSGDAGVYTLNILSTTDQNTGFTIRGLESGTEVTVQARSLANYFTIESLEDGNVITWISKGTPQYIDYSLDDGATWTTTVFTEVSGVNICEINLDEGEKALFRGNNDAYSYQNASTNGSRFASTKRVNVYGNLCSLTNASNFENRALSAPYAFANFFGSNNTPISGNYLKVEDAGNLVMPISLTESCFANMFSGCTQLEIAPKLDAANVPSYAYLEMFSNCFGLLASPEIDATVVGEGGMTDMFYHCTSLETAPEELSAKYLADYCYNGMFDGCTSLDAAPALPATVLKQYCYEDMFKGCSSLEAAPELPATTLAGRCYKGMFQNCTGLLEAPELPAIDIAIECYHSMFSGCSALETAPELPATTLAAGCYQSMFQGTALTSTPVLPATTLEASCYS